jgi:spermidine/putrescine ABC transporter ATP-binding subunit
VAAAEELRKGGGDGGEVRLEDLTKVYGPVVAVDGVTVTIDPGSFFTLLGPSGSGKTTTLMMVAGFVHPTRGAISVDGKPVADLPPQKRNLGMVFQSYAVFPHLTVFENIAFPLQVRRVPAAEIRLRVGQALELVRLAGYDRRLPRQLSGGEQQRVALARALVFRPPVLLMDEPLGALDKKLRAHMQLELKHIQRHLHVTVIYVTHDQEEALTMSDRVAVMQRGRIEQVGTPAELYEAPRNRFVADFLGESNFVDAVVVGAGGDGRHLVRTRGGLDLEGVGVGPLGAGQPVTVAIRPEKVSLADEPAPRRSPAPANACKGSVEELIYVGDATRYRVAVGADGVLTVKVQNRLAARAHRAGEPVLLTWDPAETRLFPEPPHAG